MIKYQVSTFAPIRRNDSAFPRVENLKNGPELLKHNVTIDLIEILKNMKGGIVPCLNTERFRLIRC